ncbi:hypothetical protein BGX23_012125 [Mortierella sp. AD031]|nr:hypothetical protein BGX23_012125 [Mortierella sp. AD031]
MESNPAGSLPRHNHLHHGFNPQHPSLVQFPVNQSPYPLHHQQQQQQQQHPSRGLPQQHQQHQATLDGLNSGYLGSSALNRPAPARQSQLQSRQSVPMFSSGTFQPLSSTGSSSGHQTPTQETPTMIPSSNSQQHHFSRTPSPNRSIAHSPPSFNGMSSSNSGGYSTGRLSPVTFFPGAQPLFGQAQGFQDSVSARSLGSALQHPSQPPSATFTPLSMASHPNHTHGEGLSRSNSGTHWALPNQFSPHPDQTPLSIPQTLFLGQTDAAASFYGSSGQQDNPLGSFIPSSLPYPSNQQQQQQQQQHAFNQLQQQQQQRVGRPLSTQMSFAGTPIVAPMPTQQRVLQSSVPHTPSFNPQKQSQQPLPHFQQPPQSYQQQQSFPQLQSQPVSQEGRIPMSRSDSDGSQASVLKIPAGYFPIFNGTEWVMISHAAASVAGIPIPNPQNSPSHSVGGSANGQRSSVQPQHDGAISHSGSPPLIEKQNRQGNEAGRMMNGGSDLSRTGSESRRGSGPTQVASSRASSPADYKKVTKSPSSHSPHYQDESSHTVQENLDLLELLQKYDHLSAWSRHGKSATPSELGSPVDGTSTPKRQEPFEKSLALKEILEWIEEHKDYLLREQQDLLVPAQIDFGNVNPKADALRKTIRIENHGSKIVQLQALKIIPNAFDQLKCISRDVIYAHPANGIEPMFGNIDIELCTGANLGFFSSWLLILINESSVIGRKITWNVTNNTSLDRDMDPYAKAFAPQWLRNLNLAKPRMVITGEQVETINFSEYLQSVGHPCYKKHNGKFSLEPPQVETLEVILPGQISIDLSADSYSSRLLPLLQVEKHHSEEDVSSYNLFMVEIKVYDATANFFQIQVGGLSERCPLLLRGDAIIVRQVTQGVFTGIEYRTIVHGTNMRSNSVYVHLPIGALPTLVHERWNVQFKVNNHRIREMYRAVSGVQEYIGYHPRDPAQESNADGEGDKNYSPRSFLFPTIHDARPVKELPHLTLEFVDSSLNWEQKAAVQSIVRNDYGLVPFIISGPPGTGKTKTLTETALQILMNDTQSHILITAPSHSACDTIMNRLIPFLKPQYLFRLNDPTRTFAEVPTAIMPYCFGSVYFNMPPLDDLLRFRIVVCTCADAGLLISAGASNQSLREYLSHKGLTNDGDQSRSHWTHLLIDEAAQAIEPETDIPLLCILEETEMAPQIVLCGDHQQLGPKTFLPELQMSFLERLMTTDPLYRDHPLSRQFSRRKAPLAAGDRRSKDMEYLSKTIPCFANLVQNYRCHPMMLMMPSAMFYNDTLVASADEEMINSMLGCPILPNPECPIAFVGVNGLDASQIDEAVSWYNEAEAEKVASVIESLFALSKDEDNVFKVKMTDIGVIAPFREQVKLLRQVLRSRGYAGVNVGAVEDYQGQEYRIMLVSTTRSRVKYLDQDVRQGLGLVHFRKRFNVALTRAQAMMVIVGNPELLVLDEHWADYLHFCLRNGAYTGCPLPDSILNTHATGQKGRALIGRLEMNSVVSQYVDGLDRRRWLGGNVDNEQEGFIVVPSESESGLDEDEDDAEEEDDGQGEGDSEDGYDHGVYDESVEGLSHALSHELDLNEEFGQGAARRTGGQEQRNVRDDELEKEDRDDEDDETRVAKERLALGSLNMDDTPEMPSVNLSGVSSSHSSDRLSYGNLQGGNSLLRNQYGSEDRRQQQQQQQQQQQHQQQNQHQLRHQNQQQQRQTPVLSPISWPSNDREFKRMSNSKLVLERSFDPTEQDIFEEY